VAATNVDLKAAVDRGTFRGDLYYRLHVHRVHLPPLRERTGDVEVLVAHFLARYGTPAGVTACTAEAMDALRGYAYPGNVRELEHIIQRAVAIAPHAAIELADLPEDVVRTPPVPVVEGTVTAARERAERDMIVAALERHHGEVAAAARDLQVSRTTMWRLMKKHNVSQG
jgi:transcriptional regulator with PAS, ATPase and Fis domain